MPISPKSPCRFPGCPELTYDRFCSKHKVLTEKNYNRYDRSPEMSKRYGRRWRKIRYIYVNLHPMCEVCKGRGLMTPTEEVHHIIPISKGGTQRKYSLMSLCISCYSRIAFTKSGF